MLEIVDYGIRVPGNAESDPPDENEVATAMAFLATLWRTETVSPRSPCSRSLKHLAEQWGSRQGMESYVSNGALIRAAHDLGIPLRRQAEKSPNALVGVSHAPPYSRAQQRSGRGLGFPRDVQEAAMHEAAHLLAALACPWASIVGLRVGVRTRGKNPIGTGAVQVATRFKDEDAFVRLVGYYWEKKSPGGNLLCAAGDLWDAASGFALHPYVGPAARAFVDRHERLITRLGDEILERMNATGEMRGRALAALLDSYRPHVSAFVRPEGGLDVPESRVLLVRSSTWEDHKLALVRWATDAPCWTSARGVCGTCSAQSCRAGFGNASQ